MGDNSSTDSNQGRRPYAKRSLGQNFLIDKNVVGRIVDSLEIAQGERVLEIGPGRGALTGELLATGARLTAVEIDDQLARDLIARFGGDPHFKLVNEDFLGSNLDALEAGSGRLKVAANLPYNISTPILRKLFNIRGSLGTMVVMLQKEVAERISAEPGNRARGFLTVLVERGFRSELLFDVQPGSFRPIPKVTSSVVRLVPKTTAKGVSDDDFESLASAAFRQKRKTLKNNLSAAEGVLKERIGHAGGIGSVFETASVGPKARAEELSEQEWRSLADAIFGAG